MAKLSKERYLVLSVDDSQEDSLKIQLALSDKQRVSFLGSFADGQNLVALGGQGGATRINFPMPDLLQLDMLMSRKGFEIVEWLQNQPFEDVIVVVLPRPGEKGSCVRALQTTVVTPPSNNARNVSSIDLVNLLEQYLDRRH